MENCLTVKDMTSHCKKPQQSGFTLIEIAVVLIIIGIVLGGFLMPLGAQIEKGQRKATQKNLLAIEEALLGFAMANNRLPCPDIDNDGQEDRSGSPLRCDDAQGKLPYTTLATASADAWGQAFTYHVSPKFADDQAGTGCAASSLPSFSLCSMGDIEVRDAATGNMIADRVPALVLSHGKNWANTGSADEQENSDASDAIYVERRYSNDMTNAFDDIVMWMSPNVLKNRMVSAGRLP